MECHAKKQPLQNAGELYEVFFAKFSKTIVNRMFMFMISAERCHMPANITGPQTWTKPCWPTNVYTFCVFLNFLESCCCVQGFARIHSQCDHRIRTGWNLCSFPCGALFNIAMKQRFHGFMLMALLRSQQWLPLKRPSGSLRHFYSFSL